MAESTSPSDAPVTVESPESAPKLTRRQATAGLGAAAAILVGGWFVAGKAGLDTMGRGGMNQNLLPKVGDEAPDFTTVSLRGEIVSLSDFRGLQPVWINFWGAWCAPCRAEMPDIQVAWETLEPAGLMLLAVSLRDKPSEAAAFATKVGATFPILVDPDQSLTGEHYPIYNFPTHIFVDEQGIVREIVLSPMTSEQAIATAQSVLA
ncbi:MAG: TlpA family protein disulfide reductase [Thermomicrobiales bacterium]|nr:TlpA family protein disulfide reductase [Thermomicrobiales bacterium]